MYIYKYYILYIYIIIHIHTYIYIKIHIYVLAEVRNNLWCHARHQEDFGLQDSDLLFVPESNESKGRWLAHLGVPGNLEIGGFEEHTHSDS